VAVRKILDKRAVASAELMLQQARLLLWWERSRRSGGDPAPAWCHRLEEQHPDLMKLKGRRRA
jgi:hypothetical protein